MVEGVFEKAAGGRGRARLDYGDRVPEDALFHNGKTGKELHNMFLYWFSATCYEASVEVYGEGMVWRRSGYIGSQGFRVAGQGIRALLGRKCLVLAWGLSIGFNGDAFWAGDIGGFTGWTIAGTLHPLVSVGIALAAARFHGANSP